MPIWAYTYGSGTADHHVLRDRSAGGFVGHIAMNWIMNILLAILITLAVLCVIQMGVNFFRLGWY